MKKILIALIFGGFFTINAMAQISEETAEYLMTADYTTEELADMKENQPIEYAKLLYYYMDSWYIIPGTEELTSEITDNILISRFEDKRAESEEVQIVITKDGAKLVLKSKEEVEANYAEIEEE